METALCMAAQSRTADAILARLATASHGVVTRRGLLAAGIARHDIARRLRTGTLILEYPGVYRVGHRAPSTEAAYLAAVVACGDRSLLSGLAAGHLVRIVRAAPPLPEVTVPTERRVEGIRTVRSRLIHRRDAMVFRGVPVTTVARALVDIAARLPEDDLARAYHEGQVKHGIRPRHVEAVLERRPASSGAGNLRRVMRGDVRLTLSALERRFLRLLREADLPLPWTNRRVDEHYVDCRWPDHKLTVELDSYRFHQSRYAWEQDRRREREARARGDDFRRYTWGDVFERPRPMLAELHAFFGA
ncbi:MAG: hypothetical protein WD844_05125 [Thermoleophilaceae bacterium]